MNATWLLEKNSGILLECRSRYACKYFRVVGLFAVFHSKVFFKYRIVCTSSCFYYLRHVVIFLECCNLEKKLLVLY